MTANEIISALGGRNGVACCPAHDDTNPSLSINDSEGRVLVKCHAGCSQDEVIQALGDRGLWGTDSPRGIEPSQSRKRKDKSTAAASIWLSSAPAAGTVVERYLQNRGLDILPPERVRHHKQLQHNSGSKHPAMVAQVTDVNDESMGVHRTWLSDDGAKAGIDPNKMMLGPCAGGSVRLAPATDSVMIGEGIETTLAAMQATGQPGWAALSTSGIKALKLPDTITNVTILADGDEPGEKAASEAAHRWTSEGRTVRVALPPAGKDMLDVLQEGGKPALTAIIDAAELIGATTAPETPALINVDDLAEAHRVLYAALIAIPRNALQGKHDAAHIIGYGLRHADSGVPERIGRALAAVWDRLNDGDALAVFDHADPHYAATKPVTTGSIYKLARSHGWDGCEPWPEPESLVTDEGPEPYPDALGPILGPLVDAVQRYTGAPFAMVATAALGTVSLAAQAHWDVRRPIGAVGPISLFTWTEAEPNERKSTVTNILTRAIRRFVAEKIDAMKQQIRQYQTDRSAWEAARSGLLAAIKEANKRGRCDSDLRGQLADHDDHEPAEPRKPRFEVEDATPEALAWVLAHESPSLGMMSAEGGSVFASHSTNADSISRTFSLWLKLWSGEQHTVDRRASNGSYLLRDVRLTVAIQVQRATLEEFAARAGHLLRGTGLFARVLITRPPSTQGERFLDPDNLPRLDNPAVGEFERRIVDLLSMPLPVDDDGRLTPETLDMTPEAGRAWIEIYNSIEAELGDGGELGDVRDCAGKAAENIARVAALLHVIEDHAGSISVDTITRASQIVGWHLAESRRMVGDLVGSPELVDAAKVDNWLITNGELTVKTRVVQRAAMRDGARFRTAIEILTELGRVRVRTDGPRKLLDLNPSLLEFTK